MKAALGRQAHGLEGGFGVRKPAICKWIGLFAAVAGLAILAAGCGGGGDKAAGASEGTSGEAAGVSTALAPKCGLGNGKPATGEPIYAGAVWTVSGPVVLKQSAGTVKAYFDCVNANGGINGRPVQLVIEDDGGINPPKMAQAAKALADDSRVTAIIGSGSYTECPVAAKIYADAGLVEIESAGGAPECFLSPNITSVSQGGTGTSAAAAQFAVEELGAKKIVALVPDFGTAAQAFSDAMDRAAKASGGEGVVKMVKYQPGLTDANSVVLDAGNAGGDAIVVAGVAPDLIALYNAAAGQGLLDRVKWVAVAPFYNPFVGEALKDTWAGKAYVAHQFSALNAATEDNQLWQDVMATYGKGLERDEFSQASFIAAKIYVDTLLQMEGPINRATVAAALEQVRGYKTDMLCGPWYFGVGKFHFPNHAARVAVLEADGSFKDVTGCFEIKDPIYEPIVAQEKKQGLTG